MPIRSFFKGTGQFPIQKCAIFRKFKEISGIDGGVLVYAAQAISPIDTEIAEKGHLWTETSQLRRADTDRSVGLAHQKCRHIQI
ncbi:MAG: hypothetical protein WAJ95_18140, partial [Desulfobacterales bacterium]